MAGWSMLAAAADGSGLDCAKSPQKKASGSISNRLRNLNPISFDASSKGCFDVLPRRSALKTLFGLYLQCLEMGSDMKKEISDSVKKEISDSMKLCKEEEREVMVLDGEMNGVGDEKRVFINLSKSPVNVRDGGKLCDIDEKKDVVMGLDGGRRCDDDDDDDDPVIGSWFITGKVHVEVSWERGGVEGFDGSRGHPLKDK
uniref:Uncharacterized protein n=1 Tax=Fagus sylvatica TaxID=28930 RepID=A0A2N9END4_FAGSY